MAAAPAPHNAIFAQLAARHLLAQGVTPAVVFAGTGFGQSLLNQDEPVAPFAAVASFFDRAAELSGDPLFGFHLGRGSDLRMAGLLGYIACNSPTAGCFLRNTARYAGVMSEGWEVDASRLASHGELAWFCKAASGLQAHQYIEFLAALFLTALREAAGTQIEPQEAAFSHQRRRGAEEMAAAFGCPVRFGAPASRIVFKPEDLDLPLASADRLLLEVLRAYGDQLLHGRGLGRTGTDLKAQVEEAVSARLSGGSASLGNVAADLGMSPRTLSRKLARAGTSYFTILEELRKALAIRYLQESRLSLSEIAFLLGYSGLNSFSEAFRRWTGQSPGQFRGG
ncbi:AraC family transcriptional regulator ligand-binding domain-containing protein [Leisingera sp. D0M16]|uniref:AraC family transcriptional regulator ligand-binding domain-containing protein n=1 Tax=Leisingera coralii TaxID=3351347 RepID=UPI003B7AAEB8